MTIVVPEWMMWLIFAILVLHAGNEIGEMVVASYRRRLHAKYAEAMREHPFLSSMRPDQTLVTGVRPDGSIEAWKLHEAKDGFVTLRPHEIEVPMIEFNFGDSET